MLSQKCYECALKHVATALSYAKEILGGHTEGNPLDHRIDLLGELCNLEHHLELLDGGLLTEAQVMRRILQSRGMAVNEADLQKLRDFYNAIEQKSVIPSRTHREAAVSVARSREGYLVVVDSPRDRERFQAVYEGLRKNVLNEIEIVVCKPAFECPADVAVVDMPFSEYVRSIKEECFVYMTQDCFIINRCDFNLLPDIYLQDKCNHAEKYKGYKVYPYEWDCGAPHVLYTQKVIETFDGSYTCGNVLNDYYIKQEIRPAYNSYQYVARVTDRVCCGVKQQLESGYLYATATTDEGFRSLKEWLLTKRQK